MNHASTPLEFHIMSSEELSVQAFDELLASTAFDAALFGRVAAQLFQRERFALAARVFDRWSSAQPDNPEPRSNLGLSLLRAGDVGTARGILEQTIAAHSSFAPAYNNLCTVYQFLGDHDRQLQAALSAAELQPGSALAMNNLGTALLELGRLSEAKHAFETSRLIDPGYFEAGFNLARVDSDEGRHEDALRFLEAALAGPAGRHRHYRDMIEYHLSYEYLWMGRLEEGWRLYERGFAPGISPTIARTPVRRFPVPAWDGRPLGPGQRLMIWREQGIGDELRFAALLPLLDAGEGQVIVECDPRLVPAFARSLPQIEFRAPRYLIGSGDPGVACDYDFQLPVGSLPRLLMTSKEVFGRLGTLLRPAPDLMARFAARLAPHSGKRKVGICWRSSLLSGKRNKKYTALKDWYDLLSDSDSVFVSLQYGDCEEELREAERALGIRILRWADVDLKNDLEAVMALASQLDLVISTSTAVVPLAGAVGAKTLLLAQHTWITLGETDRYPWFASVRPLLSLAADAVATCLPRAASEMRKIPIA